MRLEMIASSTRHLRRQVVVLKTRQILASGIAAARAERQECLLRGERGRGGAGALRRRGHTPAGAAGPLGRDVVRGQVEPVRHEADEMVAHSTALGGFSYQRTRLLEGSVPARRSL